MIKTILNKFIPTVSAHCDVPCGIYDPHLAQVAAHTVVRMTALIKEHKEAHDIARYTAVKEEHAELVKHEIRIIWGDAIKPEHVEKFPDIHEKVWDIMKLASTCKQEVNPEAAQKLLTEVQEFAEIFWETKGVTAVRVKAPYPTGGELVLHK
jgi:nickel superoxide dismutase